MIHLRLGELEIDIGDQVMLDILAQQGPAWLVPTDGKAWSMKEQTLRQALKTGMRVALWFVGDDLASQGVDPAYLPHPDKKDDILLYGMGYFAWLIAAKADDYVYTASYEETANGLRVTRVAASSRLVSAEAGSEAPARRGTALPSPDGSSAEASGTEG